MTQFVPQQILTRHAVLPGIRAASPNKNISECLGVNLRTAQNSKYLACLMVIRKVRQLALIRKELPNSLVRSRL